MNGVWTDNWRGIKNAFLLGAVRTGLSTVRAVNGAVANTALRFTPDVYSPFGSFTWSPSTSLQRDRYIHVGTGNAAPSASDAVLTEASGIVYLSVDDVSADYDGQTGTATRTVKVTIQNSGQSSVTLQEWGIFTKLQLNGTYTHALVYRELLDAPVTLGYLETAALTLTLSVTLSDPV